MSKTLLDCQRVVLACMCEHPAEDYEGLVPDHFPDFDKVSQALINHEVLAKEGTVQGVRLATYTKDDRALDLYEYAELESLSEAKQELKKHYRSTLANKAVKEIRDSEGDLEKIMAVSHQLQEIAKEKESKDYSSKALTEKLWDNLDKGDTIAPPAMKTSIQGLKKIIGGWRKREYYLIAGRPGMGKTSFGLQEVVAMCKDGAKASIFSLEMGADQLAIRMAAQICEITSDRIMDNKVNDREKERLKATFREIGELDMRLYDDPAFYNIERLYQRAITDKYVDDIDVVLVDYAGLIEISGKSDNKNSELTKISRILKKLSSHDVCVIVLAQMNRAVESRQTKRPLLSDLRDSGSLEQDASNVIFTWRNSLYEQSAEDGTECEELIIAKNRYGPLGSVHVDFVGPYTKYVDYKIDNSITASEDYDAPF